VMTQDEPFRSLGAEHRAMIIHQQTLIATFEPDRAVETLPLLLRDQAERELALKVVQFIPGAIEEMSPRTLSLLQRFHEVLGVPPLSQNVTEDPLSTKAALQQDAPLQAVVEPSALVEAVILAEPVAETVPEATPALEAAPAVNGAAPAPRRRNRAAQAEPTRTED